MKNAVIYARVSSDKQDVDLSISAQLKAVREYAAKNSYAVIREFVDEAESGKTTRRPAFLDMIAMAKRREHPFECILVWKYSRFARNRYDSILFKDLLAKHKVRVISINEPFENNPTGNMMEGFIEVMDEFYSANLAQEITRGLRESVSRGYWVSSNIPYGYRKIKVKDGAKERPKLEIELNQAELVKLIFKRVIENKGLKEIVKELNSQGIASPRGNTWSKTTLHGILTNELYTGTLIWGQRSSKGLPPVRVENAIPAIVNKDDFQRVQTLLKSRTPKVIHPRRVASHYLLSGIVKCGHCGRTLVGQDAKSGKFGYYVCNTLMKRGAGTCTSPYLNREKFERVIVGKIKDCILTQDNLVILTRLVNEEIILQSGELSNQLAVITHELSGIEMRLNRHYEALETGQLSLGDVSPRIKDLRAQQDRLKESQVSLIQSLSDKKVDVVNLKMMTKYVADIQQIFDESDYGDKKAFLQSFIREITVADNTVAIYYQIPSLPRQLATINPIGDATECATGKSAISDMAIPALHCTAPLTGAAQCSAEQGGASILTETHQSEEKPHSNPDSVTSLTGVLVKDTITQSMGNSEYNCIVAAVSKQPGVITEPPAMEQRLSNTEQTPAAQTIAAQALPLLTPAAKPAAVVQQARNSAKNSVSKETVKQGEKNGEEKSVLSTVPYGGAGGIRTLYLLTASQTFSQVNYGPMADVPSAAGRGRSSA